MNWYVARRQIVPLHIRSKVLLTAVEVSHIQSNDLEAPYQSEGRSKRLRSWSMSWFPYKLQWYQGSTFIHVSSVQGRCMRFVDWPWCCSAYPALSLKNHWNLAWTSSRLQVFQTSRPMWKTTLVSQKYCKGLDMKPTYSSCHHGPILKAHVPDDKRARVHSKSHTCQRDHCHRDRYSNHYILSMLFFAQRM